MMSQRNLEPQTHIRQAVNADTELLQDTLVCGVCQKHFALSDILEFIQHKVENCNKENCLPFDEGNDDDTYILPTGRPRWVGNRSTPLSYKLDDTVRSFSTSSEGLHFEEERSIDSSPCQMKVRKRVHSMDALCPEESIKIRKDGEKEPKEPSSYICSTCMQSFASAWILLQHVQHIHDMKIYLDTDSIKESNLDNVKSISFCLEQTDTSLTSSTLPEENLVSGEDRLIHPVMQVLSIPLGEQEPKVSLSSNYSLHSCSQGTRLDITEDTYQKPNPNSTSNLGLPLSSYTFNKSHSCHSQVGSIGLKQAATNLMSSTLIKQNSVSGGGKTIYPTLQLLQFPFGKNQLHSSLNRKISPHLSSQGSKLNIRGDTYQRLNSNNTLTFGLPLAHSTLGKSYSDRSGGASIGLGLDHQNDFYSKRLRQLAGAMCTTSTPPVKPTNLFFQQLDSTSTSQSVTLHLGNAMATTPNQKENNQPESTVFHLCEFCGRSFKFHEGLMAHLKLHTYENIYKCHICNQAYSQDSNLKRHLKIHQQHGTESEVLSVHSERSTPDANQNNEGKIKLEREEGDLEEKAEEKFEKHVPENISTFIE
ncbi:B-cell lymphoma/leukemia 11A-like isoform X1 [Limulus polyphemus]|uniref:B-cell lymphoma/leukemia 11A-like isoform X1 n=1 Tax=Limulus polyphemus TaxID=6850 RepID=A0ABM1SFH5_LIMPO|nr:B-cell lymphoma/leukemia 11A-like isoform X1 [Limulus polyphemus]